MRAQVLDSMELERERGITIKAQAVRVDWKGHVLNLIDTPGHVDFTYEVSRALQACEGAVLVVDAAQGIEAQTVANAYLAIENNLELLPSLTRSTCRRPTRRAPAASSPSSSATTRIACSRVSAKTGQGVEAVLDAIIERIPPPERRPRAPPRALVFDSSYDQYRGVVAFVRVIDGEFRAREDVLAMAQGTRFETEEVGFFSPTMKAADSLGAGEVGYIVTGLKDVAEAPRRRHADVPGAARRGAASGLQGREADGLRGALPDRLGRVPAAPRRARAAQAQRRVAFVRARDLSGARLRVSLRVPRPPAHGDRARAARAGVRPRPARDRADRRVPGRDADRRAVEVHNPADMPDPDARRVESRTCAPRSSSPRTASAR